MACQNNNANQLGCVAEIVNFIYNLQNQAIPGPCNTGCEREMLGGHINVCRPNTRPFVLYLPNGELFQAFYIHNGSVGWTPFFRVERINNSCCKLRCLRTNLTNNPCTKQQNFTGDFECNIFEPTNNFVTIDLTTCSAIQCLPDIYLNL